MSRDFSRCCVARRGTLEISRDSRTLRLPAAAGFVQRQMPYLYINLDGQSRSRTRSKISRPELSARSAAQPSALRDSPADRTCPSAAGRDHGGLESNPQAALSSGTSSRVQRRIRSELNSPEHRNTGPTYSLQLASVTAFRSLSPVPIFKLRHKVSSLSSYSPSDHLNSLKVRLSP